MALSRIHIRTTVEAYLAHNPGERRALAPLFNALDGDPDPTSRSTAPGHITCGAIVINNRREVLHIRHKATAKMLAPGGHNEADDISLVQASLRELTEEAGILPTAVSPLPGFDGVPIDIDIHDIDANPAKNEPAHQHYDLRFPFLLAVGPHAVTLQQDEVTGYEWRPFSLTSSPSLRAKLTLLPPDHLRPSI